MTEHGNMTRSGKTYVVGPSRDAALIWAKARKVDSSDFYYLTPDGARGRRITDDDRVVFLRGWTKNWTWQQFSFVGCMMDSNPKIEDDL